MTAQVLAQCVDHGLRVITETGERLGTLRLLATAVAEARATEPRPDGLKNNERDYLGELARELIAQADQLEGELAAGL